jgi:hypothetical protein
MARSAAKRHLIAKLKRLLDECDIRLYRRRRLLRPITGVGMAECVAYYGDGDLIEVAVLGHASVDDVVRSVIHELLHAADFPEMAVDGALEDVAAQSPTLYAAVQQRLLSIKLGLPERRDRHGRQARGR